MQKTLVNVGKIRAEQICKMMIFEGLKISDFFNGFAVGDILQPLPEVRPGLSAGNVLDYLPEFRPEEFRSSTGGNISGTVSVSVHIGMISVSCQYCISE